MPTGHCEFGVGPCPSGHHVAVQLQGVMMEMFVEQLFWKTEGTNLFVAEHADERYKAYRKTIAVAFSSQNLKKKFPGLLKEAHSLAAAVDENIEGGKAVDFQCLGVRYSFNNIGHFAYDVDFDSFKTGHPLLSALSYCTDECMLDAVNPLHKLSKTIFPFSVAAKKEKSCFQSLYALYQELFDRADLYGDDPNDEDQSIRACLMRLRNPLKNNEKPPPDELMSEFTTLLVGGTDTTGHEIGWLMMWVASNREFQDKIYCEMKAEGLAGVGAREVEFSDLAKLTYLKMVIMEVLRKSPVASTILTRTIRKDTTVLGYRLPKGTTVGSCVQAQNNAPWLWKDSKEFHPERWAKGSKEGNNGESEVRGAKGFLTFGAGVRDCVGQRLAMLELQLVLAVLVSKFTFELDPRMGGMEGAMKLGYNSLVTICDGGAWVRARRRSMDETHD